MHNKYHIQFFLFWCNTLAGNLALIIKNSELTSISSFGEILYFTECKVCGPFFRGRLTCNSLFFLCITDQAIQSSLHRVTKKGQMVSHPAFTQFEKPTETWTVVNLLLKSALPVTTRLPWVPEVFLACGGNFRCWPKADTSSAVGRSREKNFRAGHYKDLTETGNRARKVSGTQGTTRFICAWTETSFTERSLSSFL